LGTPDIAGAEFCMIIQSRCVWCNNQ